MTQKTLEDLKASEAWQRISVVLTLAVSRNQPTIYLGPLDQLVLSTDARPPTAESGAYIRILKSGPLFEGYRFHPADSDQYLAKIVSPGGNTLYEHEGNLRQWHQSMADLAQRAARPLNEYTLEELTKIREGDGLNQRDRDVVAVQNAKTLLTGFGVPLW